MTTIYDDLSLQNIAYIDFLLQSFIMPKIVKLLKQLIVYSPLHNIERTNNQSFFIFRHFSFLSDCAGVLLLFSEIIHALRIKSRPPISPLLDTRDPITANGMLGAGATGMMVGHPRFQDHTGGAVSNREHLWALGRRKLKQRMPRATGFTLAHNALSPRVSECTAKQTQTTVWITKLSKSEDAFFI